jgi:hypothetical protein
MRDGVEQPAFKLLTRGMSSQVYLTIRCHRRVNTRLACGVGLVQEGPPPAHLEVTRGQLAVGLKRETGALGEREPMELVPVMLAFAVSLGVLGMPGEGFSKDKDGFYMAFFAV